jgi:hypothetical protein
MGSAMEDHDKGHVVGDVDSASEEKGRIQHVDSDTTPPVDLANPTVPARVFQAPDFIRNMTAEERIDVENRLRRKIDIRLMPMIVIMYIMNYLDRVRGKNVGAIRMLTGYITEQHCSRKACGDHRRLAFERKRIPDQCIDPIRWYVKILIPSSTFTRFGLSRT